MSSELSPIRVYVGTDPNHCDAESQAVLEWSIRKHASQPVEITWLMLSNDPGSPFYQWDTRAWATPFSGTRWAVPELCGFEGKAIYCDSDFIFLADIAELWNQYIPEDKVAIGEGGNAWRMCCCMFDCSVAQLYIPPIAQMRQDSSIHGRLNQDFRNKHLVQFSQGDWNNLDAARGEKLKDIKALHYTCMNSQPQLEYALPRLEAAGLKHWFDGATRPHPRADVRELFRRLLSEADEHGYSVDRYIQHEPFGEVKKRSFKGRAKV